MKHIACIILIQILMLPLSSALVVELKNPPGDYNIYKWSGSSVKKAGMSTRDVTGFTFNIPDQYVVQKNGGVDINASLQKWRKSTPVESGNPRTRNGIGYYPFTDSSGNQYYLALEYLNERIHRYAGASIEVNGHVAVTPAPAAPKPDEVTPPATNVGNMPTKSKCNDKTNSKMCMVCNCFYEASTESDLGMNLVTRVVLTRMQHKGYPDSACSVVHQKSQFSWTQSSKKRNSTIPKNSGQQATYDKCVRNVAQGIKDGGSFGVHYHASYVNPRWARNCPVLKREKAHIFYRDCDDKQGTNWANNIDTSVVF